MLQTERSGLELPCRGGVFMAIVKSNAFLSLMGKSAVPNLASLLHKRIVVRIGGGHTLKGLLTGYDAFMNIVLSEVTEPSGVEDTAVVRGEFIEDVVVAEEASLSVAGM